MLTRQCRTLVVRHKITWWVEKPCSIFLLALDLSQRGKKVNFFIFLFFFFLFFLIFLFYFFPSFFFPLCPFRSNTICKANGMQPNHCGGSRGHWHRYGPIGQDINIGKTYTAKYYGGYCTPTVRTGVRATMQFTTKLCSCPTVGQGLVGRSSCVNCEIGQAAPDNKSPCAPCTAGRYQDQNVASSYGCKTCAAGKIATSSSVACTNCPAGRSQERGAFCFIFFIFFLSFILFSHSLFHSLSLSLTLSLSPATFEL